MTDRRRWTVRIHSHSRDYVMHSLCGERLAVVYGYPSGPWSWAVWQGNGDRVAKGDAESARAAKRRAKTALDGETK